MVIHISYIHKEDVDRECVLSLMSCIVKTLPFVGNYWTLYNFLSKSDWVRSWFDNLDAYLDVLFTGSHKIVATYFQTLSSNTRFHVGVS